MSRDRCWLESKETFSLSPSPFLFVCIFKTTCTLFSLFTKKIISKNKTKNCDNYYLKQNNKDQSLFHSLFIIFQSFSHQGKVVSCGYLSFCRHVRHPTVVADDILLIFLFVCKKKYIQVSTSLCAVSRAFHLFNLRLLFLCG